MPPLAVAYTAALPPGSRRPRWLWSRRWGAAGRGRRRGRRRGRGRRGALDGCRSLQAAGVAPEVPLVLLGSSKWVAPIPLVVVAAAELPRGKEEVESSDSFNHFLEYSIIIIYIYIYIYIYNKHLKHIFFGLIDFHGLVLTTITDNADKADAIVVKKDSSSDEDEDDSSDDEAVKKQQKKSTVATEKSSSSDEESEESEEEESAKTPKKKDGDVKMADATTAKTEKKAPKTPATPCAQPSGSKTLFVGNLSYSVERSNAEEFFKGASEVIDVRFASSEEGAFKGFGHVEFATEAAAHKEGFFAF
ncbi:nucleolin 2-like [Magnolia sinica]|uniref:nucleolin 2-like n=1 Tax=Magnolia sinica TaxID=86752 RepID=UPI00265AA043|nr:nucleolin 2-like [Magnolia sinica]